MNIINYYMLANDRLLELTSFKGDSGLPGVEFAILYIYRSL